MDQCGSKPFLPLAPGDSDICVSDNEQNLDGNAQVAEIETIKEPSKDKLMTAEEQGRVHLRERLTSIRASCGDLCNINKDISDGKVVGNVRAKVGHF